MHIITITNKKFILNLLGNTIVCTMEKTPRMLYLVNLCIIFGILVIRRCNATTYFVGDTSGWDISSDLESWPLGKRFSVGDVLSKYLKHCSIRIHRFQYFADKKEHRKTVLHEVSVSLWFRVVIINAFSHIIICLNLVNVFASVPILIDA